MSGRVVNHRVSAVVPSTGPTAGRPFLGVSSLNLPAPSGVGFSGGPDLRCECGGALTRFLGTTQHICSSCNAISNRLLIAAGSDPEAVPA